MASVFLKAVGRGDVTARSVRAPGCANGAASPLLNSQRSEQ